MKELINSFETYMNSKLPNYKEVLVIHDIAYLKGLFNTYSNALLMEKHLKTKESITTRIIAEELLNDAIKIFYNNRKNNVSKENIK